MSWARHRASHRVRVALVSCLVVSSPECRRPSVLGISHFRNIVSSDPLPRASRLSRWLRFLETVAPVLPGATLRDRLIACFGALVAVAAVLGTFAFAQQASASVQPAKAGVQVSHVATASTQVSQPSRAAVQVSKPARAQTQISKPALAKPQISNAQATWHGVQPQGAKALGGLSALLQGRN